LSSDARYAYNGANTRTHACTHAGADGHTAEVYWKTYVRKYRIVGRIDNPTQAPPGEEDDTCMSYEEEDTCMSYEEEDTCMSYEEDTCMSYEEDTCMS